MKKYNTAINPLGSISDLNVIIETIKYFRENGLDDTKKEFIDGNAFGFNITSSRKRFFSLIKKLFLINNDNESNQFFINTIASNTPPNSIKRLLIYLEVFRKNDLFCDITLNLIYKKYHENRRLIDTKEILSFLLDFGEGTKITNWSESTLKIISSKYISFMRRAGIFKKDKGYKSMISYPYPDKKVITYIVYLLKATGVSDNEVYNSKMFKALMLKENEIVELLKKGSLAGYYDFNFSGAKNATFVLKYEQEEIIDELFR